MALVIVWVLCGGFAALIAHNKGRSVGWFAVAGLLLGVIGLVWAAFARPADGRRRNVGVSRWERMDRETRERAEDRAMIRRHAWPE